MHPMKPGKPGRTRVGTTLAATVLASTILFGACALPARAAEPEDEVLNELRALRERVEELEAWKQARQTEDSDDNGDLARAVEQYLTTRQLDGPSGGIVVAPRTKRIEIGGMVRVRGEMQRRSPTPPDVEGRHTNEFFLGRVRLHAKAEITDDLGAYVELQDARIWGEEPGTASDTGGVDLSQGYVDFRRMFATDTTARLGRQAVSLSDQRFVGALEWSNSGRRFDGLTVTHQRAENSYTGFAYRLADGFAVGDTSDDDADLIGLWTTYPGLVGPSTFEFFAIYLNDTRKTFGEPRPGRPVTDGHTTFGTYGTRIHGVDDDGFDWDFQGAIQSGEIGGDDLSAWAARGGIGYRLNDVRGKPRFGFEYNLATGDKKTDDGDVDQFQVLFPTNHGYYGIHDLQAWSNMDAWSANASIDLSDCVTLKGSYWHFKLDEEQGGWVVASGKQLRPGFKGAGENLGSEVDFVMTWKQSERVTWQMGWAHFWESTFARRTTSNDGNTGDSDFFYLQTLVTF